MSVVHQPACRVLLVCGVPDIREVAHSAVAANAGFELVAECSLGREGAELVGRLHPDLILLYAPLPDKSPQDFIEEVRALGDSSRIILISTRPEMIGYGMARRDGADGYISGRLLDRELPLVLAHYHDLSPQWGQRFSPWKEGYGLA